MTNLAAAVANATITTVAGTFYRHSSQRQVTIAGSPAGGRWGPPNAFPVLYLARPLESAVIEAYRWLVDGSEGMPASAVLPRRLWTVEVRVSDILDLTDRSSVKAVGLTAADLSSPINDYAATRAVALAAHQLGLHGVLAPAAEGDGQTLALFDAALPLQEVPHVRAINDAWSLPPDPRLQTRLDAQPVDRVEE